MELPARRAFHFGSFGPCFGACKKRFKLNNFVPEFLIDGKRFGGMLSARFVEHFTVLKAKKIWQ